MAGQLSSGRDSYTVWGGTESGRNVDDCKQKKKYQESRMKIQEQRAKSAGTD